MDTQKMVVMWTIFEDEGYWYYSFGNREGKLETSAKFMTKMQAEKALSQAVNLLKRQKGPHWEIQTEELLVRKHV